MKINRKRMLAIGLSVTAVAAAIAIPVGIVYGIKPQAAATTPATTTVATITKTDTLATKHIFGTDPATIRAPELDEKDYKKEDYQPGVFKTTTITSTTPVGDKVATITFEYRPIAGKKNVPVLLVVYPVSTEKGNIAKGFGTNNDGVATATRVVPSGIDAFAKVEASQKFPSQKWAEEWLNDNGYVGYALKDGTGTPKYTKANNTELKETELKGLAVNATFKAEYKFALDTVRFINTATPAKAEGTLTVTYTVKKAADYKGKTAYDDAKITYKAAAPATFAPTALPEAAATDATNYEIDNTLTTYEITTNANDGTGAWVGDKIADLSAVNTYGAGTQITAHFYFKPKTDFAGTYVHTTKKLIIETKAAAAFVAPKTEVTYDQGRVPAEPAAPVIAVEGYKGAPVSWSAKVVTKSALPGANSPVAGTTYTKWADIQNLNSGTVLEITYTYALDTDNYKPASGTATTYPVTQKVTITDGTFTLTVIKDASLATKYYFGAEPSTITAPELDAPGYNKADYQAGAFKESTITSTTDVGDKKGTVTYEYKPAAGKTDLPTIRVTYPVDTQKGTVAKNFGTNGAATATREVPLGIDTFTKVEAHPQDPARKWVDQWLKDNGYIGYRLKAPAAGTTNPSYKKSDNSALTEAVMKTLTATDTFKAEYKFEIDTARFNNSTPASATEGTLTVTYSIKTAASYNGKTAYDDAKATYKSAAPANFAPTALPESTATGAANFEIDATLTSYELTKRANDRTGALVGEKVANLTAVNTYGAGTEITAHFYFKPKAGFAGNYVHTTKKLVVDKDTAAGAFADTKPVTEVGYGKFDSKTFAPVAAVKGYATRPSKSVGTVKVKGTINDANSPAAGTVVTDWTAVANWNPGTEIEVVHSYDFDTDNYVPATGKTTAAGTITQTVKITKQKGVVVPGDYDPPITSFKKGSNPNVLKTLDPSKYDTKIYSVTSVEWYEGSAPSSNVGKFETNFALLALKTKDAKFTVRYFVTLKEDYAESSNANRKLYYYRQPYNVVE